MNEVLLPVVVWRAWPESSIFLPFGGFPIKRIAVILLALSAISCILFGCARLAPYGAPFVLDDPNEAVVPHANAERFGIFSPGFYRDYKGALDSCITLLGAKPRYVLWFQQIGDAFPLENVRHGASLGIATIISMDLESRLLDADRNDTLLQEISQGVWDGTLAAFAQTAARAGTTVFLRFGYEINGNWFSWGQKPRDFIAAWNHAHALFCKNGATNVRWVFAPNVSYGNGNPRDDILSYYPGDATVDVVGLDGYNFGDSHDYWHRWQSFRSIFEPSLRVMHSLGKPLWITETACPTDARRPAWLEELFTFMRDNPCIEMLLWFDAYKRNAGEPDFRLASDSASLAAMRAWLAR